MSSPSDTQTPAAAPSDPRVTIYRAVPATVTEFRTGDWVALDEGYALMHADGMSEWQGTPWHVISQEADRDDVIWAGPDKDEWFADTGERREYFYQPRLQGA